MSGHIQRNAAGVLFMCVVVVALVLASGAAGVPIAAAQAGSAPTVKPGFPVTLPGASVRGSSVALGDLTGDGVPDMVVGGSDGRLHAYTGTGQPIWSLPLGAASIEGKAAIGDLDGDGSNEVVVGLGSTFTPQAPGALYVLEHTGAVRCSFTPGSFNNNNIPSGIVSSPSLADLDRNDNGRLEIVFGGYDATVRVLNDDCTVVWEKFVRDTVWSSPAVADLDNDGVAEIIIGIDTHLEPGFGTTNGGRLQVYRANGDLFPGFPIQIDEVIYSSPAIGDIDGDGDLEIVVGTGTCWSNPACVPPGYTLNPNAGRILNAWHHTGAAVAGWPIRLPNNAYASPALGNLDADPQPEIVVNTENDATVYAFNSDTSAVPGWPTTPRTPAGPDGSTVSFPTPASPLIADLDGDGQNEVLVPSNFEVVVWNRAGQQITRPTFPPQPRLWLLETQFTVNSTPAIGDVDGDGLLELVAASGMDASPAVGGLFVWDLSTPASTTQDWPQFRRDVINHARLLNPKLSVESEQVSLLLEQGGQASATVTLTDLAGGVLAWSAASSEPWLVVAPENGTTPGTLQITGAAADLTPGTYQGSVTVTSGSDSLTINVQMRVVQELNRIYLPFVRR